MILLKQRLLTQHIWEFLQYESTFIITANAHAYCNHHILPFIQNVLLTLNHMRQLGGWQLHDRYHGSLLSSVTVLGSTLRISHGYSGRKVL